MRAMPVACLVLFAAAAIAVSDDQGRPAEPRRFESADRRVAIGVPADWKVEPEPPAGAVIALRATLPSGPVIVFDVYHVEGVLDPRARAYYERGPLPLHLDDPHDGEVFLDPMPHRICDATKPGYFSRKVWIYRVIDRNGFSVLVSCNLKMWPDVKDACFAAVDSLTSTIPEWPAPPPGTKRTERDGYEYFVQPSVKEDAVATLHAALLDLEKKYAAVHGPVPKPAWNRPIVIVSADRATSTAVPGQGRVDSDFCANVTDGRLFAVPLRKDDADARAVLAREAYQLFHAQSYAYFASAWLCAGERSLACVEATLRRGLPSVPDYFCADWVPKTVVTIETLLRDPMRTDGVQQATAYAALFHGGPKPWRDAFAKFLADLGRTGDWQTAEKDDLMSLDQEKLRAAAQAYLKELKPVKTK